MNNRPGLNDRASRLGANSRFEGQRSSARSGRYAGDRSGSDVSRDGRLGRNRGAESFGRDRDTSRNRKAESLGRDRNTSRNRQVESFSRDRNTSRNRKAESFSRDRNASRNRDTATNSRTRGAASLNRQNVNSNRNRSVGIGAGTSRSAGRSTDARNALNSQGSASTNNSRAALINPNTRTQIAATAATAGWRDGRGRGREGWWRHRNGGYGWVGPLFWPFAYYDIYDYTLWGYGYDEPFWGYGYGDIYTAIFSPYSYDELSGYLSPGGHYLSRGDQRVKSGASGARKGSRPDQLAQGTSTRESLAQMCGEDTRDIAGLPIEQFQQAIQPDETQRAALDELASASLRAAQEIRAACPTQIPTSAPARLEAMQRRIEAMIAAVGIVQGPLQKFYDLLDDEQKARLNALRQDQRPIEAAKSEGNPSGENCGITPMAVTGWPEAEIDTRVHLTANQRVSLAALQDATIQAADMLKASCQTGEAITPPARLEAIGKRLDVMLQAVKTVRAALDDFYGQLSDEQKAQFEAIGPRRSASADRR